MKQVTVYQSDDGARWDTQAEAAARDDLIRAVADVSAPMGPVPRRFLPCGGGYVRHDPATAGEFVRKGIALIRRVTGVTSDDSEYLRMSCLNLSPVPRPLVALAYRIGCIDAKGREWEQPHHACHPGAGKVECIEDRSKAPT